MTLINAFVSIEDERFWTHSGVDWKRTFGAVMEFAGGNDSYGGSTITQQLIKNITKEDDTTIQRKVTEIFRALSLSQKRSREEILEMYLNTIHLSRSNYGVQAASNYYFGKDVSELDLVECAALASIPKSPTKYDPVKNPDNNKERRVLVLDKMAELGYITDAQAEAAKNTELVINQAVIDKTITTSNSYFKDALIEQIIADLSSQYGYSREYASNYIYSGGLEIYTTMDPEIQKIMEEVFSDPETFQKVSDGIQPEAAMVVMDPYTGYVKGIVGGREKTGDRDLNRATQSKRQIGSSIKPLTVYAPAMDLGLINYGTAIDDTPVKYEASIGRYWPKNAPDKYDGYINLNRAVEVSKNTTAVKVLEDLTVDYSFNFAKNKLRLHSLVDSDKDLAPLAMGGFTHGLTVLEVTAAYSIFPNGGTYTAPRLYTKILKSDGTILLETSLDQESAISSETAAVMTKILQNVVSSGTAAGITLDNRINVAGKTGSTNDDKDRYFAGFTPYYVGACWFGYDTPKYLGRFYSNPAMIAWEKVMTRIHQKQFDKAASGGEPLKTFNFNGLTQKAICLDSGLLPGPYCSRDLRGSRTIYAWFTKDQIPTDTCDVHMRVKYDSTTGNIATPYCPDEICMEVALVRNEERAFTKNLPISDAQ
ncbi:MAG: PBP1A family penicillin-binding protein [Clostridia bacterium]|nr:PBP1A family penicillin-binding protein [Clostridia bacterium]